MPSIFATKNTPAEEVEAIVMGIQDGSLCEPDGTLKVAEIQEVAPSIGYSRFYLIAKRAWVEANAKSQIVRLTKKQVAEAEKKFSNMAPKDVYLRHVVGPVVRQLRKETELSWGDISVLLTAPDGSAISESLVRKAFNASSGDQKDKGDRIGKGGRWAYDDPTLYAEHRRAEGAHIPVDYKGRPKPEDLLNFEREDAKSA